jgi:hypothetical protein
MNEIARGQSLRHSPSEERSAAFSLPRRAVLVLGMHRSGTSALGGVISALGVAGPKTLASPNQWNPRGYFESPRIFAAHDELLAAVDSCWDDWRQLDPLQVDTKAGRHRQAIKELLIDEFGNEPLIFIKDPRICRFVPFTLSILAELNIRPVAVLPIRNPLEVALSLQRRDNFSLSKSIMMWLRHVLDAEHYSRGLPRYFVPYEGLLQDWRHQVDRLTEKTGIEWPDSSDRSSAEVNEFLTSDLYHEQATQDETEAHPEVSPLVCETYRTLLEIYARGENEKLRDQFDTLRLKFNEDCRVLDEPSLQLLLANAGRLDVGLTNDRQAAFHVARGKDYRLLGNTAAAKKEFRAALAWNGDYSEAHDGLAALRLPGEDYLVWLAKLQAALRPPTYLEIGVDKGRSLALAKPPTRVVGVDPDPRIDESLEAETQVFSETSDAFFSCARLESFLNGHALDLAFIDGLHLFEQVLKDFMNIESHSSRYSIILIHDTFPLDEPTQRRARSTAFYTGDVWKAVLVLMHYRPDLDIITIKTPPTGLTVVTGLDPSSHILAECYDKAVKRFMEMPYTDVEIRLCEELNLFPNDWTAFEEYLKVRKISVSSRLE